MGEPQPATSAPPSGRDRYFDLLRAIAMIRVVFYHAFPYATLELFFPSMGVMFALGGSLMVKSLDRNKTRTIKNRVRRLVPALWAMAIILVPLMFYRGWDDHPPLWRLLFWVLPVADPPASEWGYSASGVLWYLVTYLWLVLLSPGLLWLYRKVKLVGVLLPIALLAVFMLDQRALGPTVGWVVQNVLAYGTCWVLGMAHREGDLAKIKMPIVVALGVACSAGGLLWAFTHPRPDGVDIISIPLAYSVYQIGFVLVLLRLRPPMGWLARSYNMDNFVSMVNNRAVTIYLWHNVAITLAVAAIGPLGIWRIPVPALQYVMNFAVAIFLVAVAVLALGWVEDVAARRPARLNPFPPRKAPTVAIPAQRGPVPAVATASVPAVAAASIPAVASASVPVMRR